MSDERDGWDDTSPVESRLRWWLDNVAGSERHHNMLAEALNEIERLRAALVEIAHDNVLAYVFTASDGERAIKVTDPAGFAHHVLADEGSDQ